ncbi:MAG TPA: hypothetical protein VIX63_12665 [Vicinamibacterales bacterium]
MRRCVAVVVLAGLLAPAPAAAWGFEPHRFIMDRAIALLPQELRPLFEKHRAMVVERAIDPDTWRTAGFGDEPKNHFLDLDWEGFGKYPFNELPRDYNVAIAKFGRDRVEEMGTLPWRVEEFHGNLRRAFESYSRRGSSGQFDIIFFSASLAHYVSDGHVPFHAVVNYDGQLTGQHGIHSRFESALFERYRDQLTIAPKSIAPVRNPRDFMFVKILEGTQLVPAILKADLEAIGSGDVYDDAYFKAFFSPNRPVLERRLNEAIAGVAAMIAGAWEAAGKPPVPSEPSQIPQRRRR